MNALWIPVFISVAGLTFLPTLAMANAKRVQGRAFYSQMSPDPVAMKSEMQAKGVSDFGIYQRLGADFTYPVSEYIDLGARIENITSTGTQYSHTQRTYGSKLEMNTLQALLRVPVLKTSFFRFDVFGTYGIAAAEVELATATSASSVSGRSYTTGAESRTTTYGASVGVGYNGWYLYAEAGRSVNLLGSLEHTGSLSTSFRELDLSADYIAVGFIHDGDFRKGK